MKLNKKNKVLIFGFGILMLLSYQLGIKKTMDTYKVYSQNKAKKEALKNVPKQLARLTQKERMLDTQLSGLNVEDVSMQNNLLSYLNGQAAQHGVKIKDFNSPHVLVTETQKIETQVFNLEGSYTAILKTLNSLENNGSFGAMNHIQLEKKKDYRSKRTFLEAQVFLEQVR